MQYDKLIELGHMEKQYDAAGYPAAETFVSESTAFAEEESVTRDEFYKAAAIGKTLTETFVLREKWSYHEEPVVKCENRLYTVVRAYFKKKTAQWFLNCTMLKEG